jgi:hypothetical protein
MGRLQNNPSRGWVHPKSTHAHPLAWANKKLTCEPVTLSIQPTFDFSTLIPTQKVFPQCLSIGQSQQNVVELTFNTQQLDELKTLIMPIQLLK